MKHYYRPLIASVPHFVHPQAIVQARWRQLVSKGRLLSVSSESITGASPYVTVLRCEIQQLQLKEQTLNVI